MKGIFTKLFLLVFAVLLLGFISGCEFMSPMDSVQNQMDDNEQHDQEQDERLSDLEQWTEDFELEFASYQAIVESRFVSVESHLNTIDGRLDNLELTDEELWEALDEVNDLIVALQDEDEAIRQAIQDVIEAYQDADTQLWQDTLDLIAQKEALFMAEIQALTDRLAEDEQIFWQTISRLVNYIQQQDDLVRSEFQAADAQLRQDGEDAYNALQDTIYTTAQRLLNVMNTKAAELQGQIDGNADAISNHADAISGLTMTTGVLLNWNAYQQGQIWDLQDEVDALRVELHDSVAALQTQIDDNYADLQAQIDANDADIASLVSDLNTLSNTVSTILDEQVAQDLRMDGMQAEIDALEVTAGNLAADILALSDRVDIVEGDIETIQTNITSMMDSIASLAGRVGDNETAITNLQNALGNLQNRVDALEVSDVNIIDMLNNHSTTLGTLSYQLTNIQNKMLNWRGAGENSPSNPQENDAWLYVDYGSIGVFGYGVKEVQLRVYKNGHWATL